MEYEWDKSKPRINKTKHGVDFSSIDDFDWTTAFVMEDQRHDYGKILNIALGVHQVKIACAGVHKTK